MMLMVDYDTLTAICRAASLWRRSRGYTLAEIADMTGYSVSVVSSFERGKNNNALLLIAYIKLGFKGVMSYDVGAVT